MKVLLVTGGSGFVGSNFINYFLRRNKNYINQLSQETTDSFALI